MCEKNIKSDSKHGNYTYSMLDIQIALDEAAQNITSTSMVRESSIYTAGKRQGDYTLEDYYALPDNRRVELIDGVIYDMSSPSSAHQLIIGKIFTAFSNYIDEKKGSCIPVSAPLDVRLDCDDKTILQPDVLILCDRENFKDGIIYGAPDLVVEVLSESTRKKDLTIKLSKYASAGVREYWIVDPEKQKVIVYEFEKNAEIMIYSFEHKVQVGIFNGECQIDFKAIEDYVSFLK